jgi:hypothetical protein
MKDGYGRNSRMMKTTVTSPMEATKIHRLGVAMMLMMTTATQDDADDAPATEVPQAGVPATALTLPATGVFAPRVLPAGVPATGMLAP